MNTLHRCLLLAAMAALPAMSQSASTPSALPSERELMVPFDRATSTLTAGINASTLMIPVASGAKFPLTASQSTLVTIEDEIIRICARSGNNLTACNDGRGFSGSTAASHVSGKAVDGRQSAFYHRRLAAEVAALAEAHADNRAFNFVAINGIDFTGFFGTAGAQTLTFVRCPVAGANTGHRMRLTNGVSSELISVTGGSCTRNGQGTLTFVSTVTYLGGTVTLRSASAGIQEYILAFGGGRGVVPVAAGAYDIWPDVISIPELVSVTGKGAETTALVLNGSGTNGISLTSSSHLYAGLTGVTVEGRNGSVVNGVLVTGVQTGLLRDVRIFGFTNGLRFGALTKFMYVQDALIQYQSNCGFLSDTDTSGENHFTDVGFGGAPTQTGFCVSRTTNADIGGYWFTRVKVGGGGVVPTGLSFVSSAANTPFILNATASTFDGIYGNAWVLTNAQNVTCDGCWFSSVRSGYATIKITDGSLFSFVNSTSLYATAAPAISLLSPGPTANSPSTIRAFNNVVADLPGGTQCLFAVGAGVAPGDLAFGGNRAYNVPVACSGNEAAIAGATSNFQIYQSGTTIYTNPAGTGNSKFGLYDPLTDTYKFMHVNDGALEIIDSDLANVVLRLDDFGNLTVKGAAIPGTVTYTNLVFSTNGGMYYCSNCRVLSASDNTCQPGGTGALAVRINGTYRCFASQN